MPSLDPFDWFAQNGPQQADPAAVAAAQTQLRQPMQPGEEDSLLRKAIGAGASGLSYAAGTLDKLFGGRAIRGLLGGVPREILSAIPGSDMLGITNPEDRVSGEQLLKNAGVLEGDGTKGEFELRDLAGPALEAALDPATYLLGPGAALTKEGQVAKRIGAIPGTMAGRIAGHATPEAVAATMGRPLAEAAKAAADVGVNINDLVGKPLAGVAGLRIPLLGHAMGMEPAILGTGSMGQAVSDKLGGLFSKAQYSTPGRYLSAAFDPAVRGSLDAGVQSEWRAETAAARARDVQARLDALGVAQPLMDAGVAVLSGLGGPLRGMVEGTRDHPGGPYTPDVLAALDESRRRAESFSAADLAAKAAAGVKAEPLSSVFGTGYAPRSPTPLEQAAGVKVGMPKEQLSHQLYSGVGNAIQRQGLLDVPGATDTLNAMVMDPRIGTKARAFKKVEDIQDVLSHEYIHPDPARLGVIRNIEAQELASRSAMDAANGNTALVDEFNKFGLDPVKYPLLAEEKQVLAQKEALVNGLPGVLGSYDPRRLKTGLFGNDLVSDLLAARQSTNQAVGRANVATRAMGAKAVPGLSHPGYTPLNELLNNLGLTDEAGFKIMDQAGIRAKDFKHVQIPNDTAAAVMALVPKLQAPDYVKGPLGIFDSLTNLTRGLQTAPWPGKHVRDLTTAAVQNLQQGSPGALSFGAPAIKTLREGGIVKGLADAIPEFRGMTDAEATAALGKELYSQNAAGSGMSRMSSLQGVSPTEPMGNRFIDSVPGMTPEQGMLGIAKDYIPKSLEEANPFNLAGFNGRNTSKFTPVAAGREMGDLFDDMGRGGLYADLRRQGYTPDAAGKMVEKTQFTYQLTDFERKVMKRIAPFYSWMRQVTPQQLGFLGEQPGGFTGQMLRASDALHQRRGFEPSYLEDGLAIPMGGEDESGVQRYLTKLDMPWEGPFGMFETGPRGPQNTMMGLLSQLNPMIKGPLEFATGKQFYSGRDLDSLYARTGNQALDQVLMNSPVSRLLTTASTLADERKGVLPKLLNLGTGVRLSDVDMGKQRQEVGMDAVRDLLRTSPNARTFQDLYVPKEQLPQLSPDQLQMLRLYQALEKQAQQQSRQKKLIGGSGGG